MEFKSSIISGNTSKTGKTSILVLVCAVTFSFQALDLTIRNFRKRKAA
jgi:hypothetical protein